MRLVPCGLLLFALIASHAWGGVYKWEDEDGIIFFTDDLNKVPERYRSQVEKVLPSENEQETPKSRSAILFEQKTDALGKEKKWWRDLVKKWEEKKRDAENRIEELQIEIRQLAFHNMTPKVREREKLRLTKLIQAAKLRRDVAIRMLTEGLPDEARKAGAPLEWLSDKP